WADFHQRAIAIADYPHVCSVKQYSGSSITNRERAEVYAISRPQLGHSLIEIVCDPNILSLGRNTERAPADRIRSQDSTRGAESRDGLAEVIGYPDAASRKRQTHRALAGCKVSEIASGLAEFRYAVAVSISDPDVGAIEGEPARTITGSVSALYGASRRIELRDVVTQQVGYPDAGARIK